MERPWPTYTKGFGDLLVAEQEALGSLDPFVALVLALTRRAGTAGSTPHSRKHYAPVVLAFDQSPTAMAIILLDGTIVKVNRQLRKLLGYDDGELVGASAETFSVRGEEERVERRDEIAATDATHSRPTQLRRKDGAIVSAVTSALIVRDDHGEPRYVIARAAPLSET
jgi:PAS domain S-box-containing protein